MPPYPPHFTPDEIALCERLRSHKRPKGEPQETHSLTIPYAETPHRLIAEGWVCMWPGEMKVTFTPIGARALELTLDGEPARWCDRDEVRRLRAKRGGSGAVARETDAGVDLDAVPGPLVPPTIVLMGRGGWTGLMGLELHIAQKHPFWSICEVCRGAKLPEGTGCGRCDGKPVHGVAYKRGMAG